MDAQSAKGYFESRLRAWKQRRRLERRRTQRMLYRPGQSSSSIPVLLSAETTRTSGSLLQAIQIQPQYVDPEAGTGRHLPRSPGGRGIYPKECRESEHTVPPNRHERRRKRRGTGVTEEGAKGTLSFIGLSEPRLILRRRYNSGASSGRDPIG